MKKKIFIKNNTLSLYIIILTTVVLIISAISIYSYTLEIKKQLLASIEDTIKQITNNIDGFIYDVEYMMASIHSSNEIQELLKMDVVRYTSSIHYQDLQIILSRTDQQKNKVFAFRIFTNKPSYYVQYNSSTSKTNYIFSPIGLQDEEWYEKALELNGKYYWTVTADTNNDIPIITASRAIVQTSNPNNYLGVLRADILLSTFLKTAAETKFGETGRIFLMHNDQFVETYDSLLPDKLAGNAEFRTLLDAGSDESGFVTLDGIEYLISYTFLSRRDWKLVAIVPSAEVMQFAQGIYRSVKIILFLNIFTIISFVVFLYSRIYLPIRKLGIKMQKSDFSQRVVPQSDDEIGILYSSFNKMLDRINKLLKDVSEAAEREKNAELKSLQDQINPHFIYNTLDSVKWLIMAGDKKCAVNMITSLGDLLRFSLSSGNTFIKIEDECHQVIAYMTIQKIRYKDIFDFRVSVDDSIKNMEILKLILQPLVENSIIHGFENYAGDRGVIDISVYPEAGYVNLVVKDNGAGCDVEYLNQRLSEDHKKPITDCFGIINIYRRLRLHYGDSFSMRFYHNEPTGVIVKIMLQQQGEGGFGLYA